MSRRSNRAAARHTMRVRAPMWLSLSLWLALASWSCHDAATLPAVTDLIVSVETSGGDPDTSGYRLVIDDTPTATLAPNGTVTLTGIGTGRHHFRLDGVAPNCQVAAPHPLDFEVRPGAASLQFHVQCLTTGITVSIHESGQDRAAGGYLVSLNGGPDLRIYPNATLLFSRLTSGGYMLTLTSSATNCTVQGDPMRLVVVTPGTVIDVAFNVDCEPITGSVKVSVSSTGTDIDLTGYQVRVDDGPPGGIDSNGAVVISKLADGAHTIALSDVSRNCTAAGGLAQTAIVKKGEVTAVAFVLTCTAAEMVAFARWVGNREDILLGFADGNGTMRLTDGGEPEWSPDGQQLVVSRQDCSFYYYCYGLGLFVVGRNGAELRQLTNNDDHDAAWSPDGQRLAFTRYAGNTPHIYLMNADGTGAAPLEIQGFPGYTSQVAWSPDGTRLAFTCGAGNGQSLCLVNTDGSGFTYLATVPAPSTDAAWSPDGTHIAFTLAGKVAVMDADGSDVRVLALGGSAAWSPDGSRIVFRSNDTIPGICIIDVIGGALTTVSTVSGDSHPAWRP